MVSLASGCGNKCMTVGQNTMSPDKKLGKVYQIQKTWQFSYLRMVGVSSTPSQAFCLVTQSTAPLMTSILAPHMSSRAHR